MKRPLHMQRPFFLGAADALASEDRIHGAKKGSQRLPSWMRGSPPVHHLRSSCLSTFCRRRALASSRGDASTRAASLPQVTCGAGSLRRVSSCSCRRSEEHTSELQSQSNLVCRLLLEKKNKNSRRTSQ